MPHHDPIPLNPLTLQLIGRRLLKEVELRADSRDQSIIYTLLYTGLRVGELAHLQIEDVQLSERKVTLVVRGDHAKGGKQRQVQVPARRRSAWRPIWISVRRAKASFS